MNTLPPGLAGFVLAQQQARQEDESRLDQRSKLMAIQAAVEQQRRAQEGDSRNQAMVAKINALPPDKRTKEYVLPIIMEFARSPQDVTTALQLDKIEPLGAGGGVNPRTRQVIPPAERPAQARPAAPSGLSRLIAERDRLPPGDPNIPAYEAAIRKATETPQQITPPQPRTRQTKDIVDPLNPAQMITIDLDKWDEAKYRAGDKSGVIGVAGKEPTAAKRSEKEDQGKELLRAELDNLREHYRVLNEARAIPSSGRGGASNAAAWVQGSTVGQLGGRVLGTKEQDARNQIQSARLRIMNAIKNATGMSAQQLNSNVELKTWLDSLTSLTGSYESNVGIIDSMEEAFLKPKAPKDAPKEDPLGIRK